MEQENVGSWFGGVCKECDFLVIVTPADIYEFDYKWACANPECKNHKGECTGDMDRPEWVSDSIRFN